MKKDLRFICAQPANIYYSWQVEVMIHNFMEMEVNPNLIDIVCYAENGIAPSDWRKLADKYNYVRFFFYDDTRQNKGYISSIRPNILKQHWKERPEIKNDSIFYHDCDIAFTSPISKWITDDMINDDKWYGSDTRWYIGHDYIKSKGEDVLDLMCDIVGIDKKLVEANELNAIGAQYIMKGISHYFWERVERECEILFKDITELNSEKVILDRHTVNTNEPNRSPYHPLQIWCADMWAVLWNAWKMGYETVCHKNLEFSWGTSSDKLWNDCNIFHNAGVVNSTSGLFYKSDYINKLPYKEELDIKEGTTSYEYWKLIKKVGEKSVLI